MKNFDCKNFFKTLLSIKKKTVNYHQLKICTWLAKRLFYSVWLSVLWRHQFLMTSSICWNSTKILTPSRHWSSTLMRSPHHHWTFLSTHLPRQPTGCASMRSSRTSCWKYSELLMTMAQRSHFQRQHCTLIRCPG